MSDALLFAAFLGLFLCAVCKAYYDSESYRLTCVISDVNGKTYCVRDRAHVQQAADMFARVADKCTTFVSQLAAKFPQNPDVQRLAQKYNPNVLVETLPTSEFTAFSEDKGRKVALCINRDDKSDAGNDRIAKFNTVMFVAIHELAHIMTVAEGHPSVFWKNFRFLLAQAHQMNIMHMVDYKNNPEPYCGMTLSDNPFYDM